EAGHDGAEAARGRDRLQPCNAGAEHEHLRRRNRSGRGHQHREEAWQLVSGARKPTRTVPLLSASVSCADGGATLATMSASSAASTICAPASSYASSVNDDWWPASRSTATSTP